MKAKLNLSGRNFNKLIAFLLPFLLYWIILQFRISSSFSQSFHSYSLALFLLVLVLYYAAFQAPEQYRALAVFGLTMTLFALSLSYIWSSGFSDNFLIGGLLPYKDAKNYYAGANLILNGLPMVNAGQATERPLFPGFLASVLLLTHQNLKIALGLIVQFAGIGLYVSTQRIYKVFGVLAASLFATLLYFYIQPWIGYTLSELLGFIAGCWGFTMIWLASEDLKISDLILGSAVLLLAVSARAGAFLIFPLLALWMGWMFRSQKRFSWKAVFSAVAILLVMYVLMNPLFSREVGIPPGSSFGNFSYALYGQVRGGTGWHSAIAELGTRNPDAVYRAAWNFFLKHPVSILIGFAKAYRDFFWLGDGSIFPFSGRGWQSNLNLVLWLGTLLLLVRGLFQLLKDMRARYAALLLAGFVGVFLSIPFLPPIDGGSRFHAGTICFFFAPLAIGITSFTRNTQEKNSSENNWQSDLILSRSVSASLLAFVFIVPIFIYALSRKPVYSNLSCPAGQQSFSIKLQPDAYLDLVKDTSTQCGFAPEVCLNDFEKNNTELKTDDFYQYLISHAKRENTNVRLIPAFDLIQDDYYYFYLPLGIISNQNSSSLIEGCGVEIRTKNQNIFQVKSISPDKK